MPRNGPYDKREIARLRKLVRVALDALDAEKTPDFGEGHDRAVAALSEALHGTKPADPYAGARSVPLDELRTAAPGSTEQGDTQDIPRTILYPTD